MRRLKAQLVEYRQKLLDANDEIIARKDASGLECGGDPDGVTPAAAKEFWDAEAKKVEAFQAQLSKYQVNVEVLQLWEGYVLEVNQDSFIARLIDKSGQNDDEEVDIFLEEVHPRDRSSIVPEAYFDWTIERRDSCRGREQVSIIRFRSLQETP